MLRRPAPEFSQESSWLPSPAHEARAGHLWTTTWLKVDFREQGDHGLAEIADRRNDNEADQRRHQCILDRRRAAGVARKAAYNKSRESATLFQGFFWPRNLAENRSTLFLIAL